MMVLCNTMSRITVLPKDLILTQSPVRWPENAKVRYKPGIGAGKFQELLRSTEVV